MMAEKKTLYRIKNWDEYNRSLINRGNITIWFSQDSVSNWFSDKRTGKKGRPEEYSDIALECCLVLRSLLRLPLRATQGFIESLILLLKIDIKVPNYSLLSKRASKQIVKLKNLSFNESIDIVIDSTGLKIFGEGEWKIRCHGKSKRRKWRKLHLTVNAESHEIITCKLTDSNTHDCEVIDDILPNDISIRNVCADGAYDNQKSYDAIVARKAIPLIPPRSGAARIKNPSMGMVQRNHNVEACWRIGKDNWKKGSGYHRRSLAETAMFRFKTILGSKLSSIKFENQLTEAKIKIQILNKMTHLGMPESYKVS
jgi:hypothetical protein